MSLFELSMIGFGVVVIFWMVDIKKRILKLEATKWKVLKRKEL